MAVTNIANLLRKIRAMSHMCENPQNDSILNYLARAVISILISIRRPHGETLCRWLPQNYTASKTWISIFVGRQGDGEGFVTNIHYENTPMQHTAIIHARENDNFYLKIVDCFLIFAQ